MLYEQWYATLFNIIYLTPPLMIMAWFDTDVHYRYPKPKNLNEQEKKNKSDLEIYERPLIKENYYKLYYTTKESTFFNFKILLFEIFKALCQGVVIAAVTICSVEQ